MRVLLTAHGFPPANRAGAELYTYYVAQGLRRAGHDVHVLHRARGDRFAVAETSRDDIPCTVVTKPVAAARTTYADHDLGRDGRVDTVFAGVLRSFRPDVVHVNHLLNLSTGLPRTARQAEVPVVFTLHDYWLFCERIDLLERGATLCPGADPERCGRCCETLHSRWPDWQPDQGGWAAGGKRVVKALLRAGLESGCGTSLFRRRAAEMAEVVRATTLFIAPSRFLLDRMVAHGVPPEKLVYCDNGMRNELFARRVARPDRLAGRLRFGFVGQISRHKGLDVLLTAFRGFGAADLVLYGRENEFLAPYRDVLAQDNVDFRGELLDDAKAAALAELDALIVPSVWYENSPLVIHEAFLAGVPVVTSDVGGMAELVEDGRTGVHFRVGNAADLRAKLTRLCADPGVLGRMRPNIPAVKGMTEHIPELIGFYTRAGGPTPAGVAAESGARV
jgi:glycosyltransferase involved in cell wall biosynthesis